MTEVRWINGKEEYNREEIEHMLSTQRAMIYNDTKLVCIKQSENLGVKGELTHSAKEVLFNIGDCRKVVF